MGIHFSERRSFVETPAGFIARLEDMIEELIAMRDALDGDIDLEDGHDAEADGADEEPSFGWTEREAALGRYRLWDTNGAAFLDEAEVTMPTVSTFACIGASQDIDPRRCGYETADDAEDGHDDERDTSDDEASLGWSEGESLTGDLTQGSSLGEDEDGDEDADI